MAELITKLTYEENTSARKKLLAGIAEIETEQKKLAVAFSKGEIAADEYEKKLKDLNKQNALLKKAVAPLNKEFKEQEKQLKAAEKAAEKARTPLDQYTDQLREARTESEALSLRLGKLDEDFSKVSQQVGQAGDIATGISDIGGAVSAIPGAGGLGSATGAAAGAFDFIEQLPRLKTAAQGLPDILQAAAGSAGLGGLAEATTAAIPALGATGGAIVALSAVALPLIVAIGSVSFAMNELNKINKEAAEAARASIEARQAQADTEREFSDLLSSGDIDTAVQERNSLFEERARLADDIAREQQALNDINQSIQETGFGGAIRQGLRAQRKEIEDNLGDIIESASILDVQLREADEALSALSDTELTRANNAELLEQVEQQTAQVEAERVQTLAQLEAAQAKVDALDNQRANLIGNRAQAEADAARLSELEAQFAAEDQLAKEAEFRQGLADIAQDGRDKVASIEQDIADLRGEREKALADVAGKGTDKLAKIEADSREKISEISQSYFKDNIKATREFQKQTERLEEDNKKARIRLIQDITDSLNDAQRNNDVIAFLNAQRDGARKLREQSEDAGETEKRRVEDFAAKQEEAAAKQQEQIQAIIEREAEAKAETLANIEEERQKILESFAERKAQLEEAKQEQILATQAALQAELDRKAQEEAAAQQKADRDAQRQAIKDEIDQRRFDEQLAQIEEKKQAELAALHAVEQSLSQIEARAGDLARQTNELSTPTNSPAPSFSSGGNTPFNLVRGALDALRGGGVGVGERIPLRPFASGGIVTKPTIGLVGEAGREAVIPLDSPTGRGLTGGQNSVQVSVNMPVTVGDIATASQVTMEVRNATEAMVTQLSKFFNNALAGVA